MRLRRLWGSSAITMRAGACSWLEYEAYEPLASRRFERIATETAERWPAVRLALHHRIGRLEIGEASVAIAARRRIAPTPSRPAATRSSASSRSRRSGSTSSSTAATSGSRARPPIRTTHGARRRRERRMRVTVRLFARLRDIAGAAELRASCRPAPRSATSGRARRRVPGAGGLRALDLERGQRRLRAHDDGARRTATKSRFCRRCRADERGTGDSRPTDDSRLTTTD